VARVDANAILGAHVTVRGALAYTTPSMCRSPTHRRRSKERVGRRPSTPPAGPLPGISKWAASFGTESRAITGPRHARRAVGGFDISYRDRFSSSATPSHT